MARRFFGNFLDRFKFTDEQEKRSDSNKIATENHDGSIEVSDHQMSQFVLNLDWAYNSQAELIETYRNIANYNIVSYAIEDINAEMISFSEEDDPIEIDLSNIDEKELSDNIKEKIYESFDKITNLLKLKQTIHRRAKQFYIDGRLAYQKVIDQKKPGEGLIDIVELDVKNVTKYRNIQYDRNTQVITGIEESFIYDENAGDRGKQKDTKRSVETRQAMKLNPNTITYVTSGLVDPKTGYAISWLHKAVRPANQLQMIENALLIYRISRAPERRIFYVDVSDMPRGRAQQYLQRLKNGYRNRMSFDPEKGIFKDEKHLQTMQEDFWLPRNSSGRGTEVSTLPGGENLGQIEDILYFQKQLYKALNIPISRLEDNSMVSLGRQSEITRDELKFSRFVSSIRKRFNMMLLDLLKTELILTKVIDISEWNSIEQKINFKYALDQYLEENKESEILRDRLDLLRDMKEYAGTYVSHNYIRTNILRQTETDIEEMDKEIEEEKKSNKYEQQDDYGGSSRF